MLALPEIERFDTNGDVDDNLQYDAALAELLHGSDAQGLHHEDGFCDFTPLAIRDSTVAEPLALQAGEGTDTPPTWLQNDPLDALGEIDVVELGLTGPGARPCPGETQCLFCLAHLPAGPSNKRWHHNVQHPGAAAKLLSTRPHPSSGIMEGWTVQLKPYFCILNVEQVFNELRGKLHVLGVLDKIVSVLGDQAVVFDAAIPIPNTTVGERHRDHNGGFGKLLKVIVSLSDSGVGTAFAPSWQPVLKKMVLFDGFLEHQSPASPTMRCDRVVLTFAALTDADSRIAAHQGVVGAPKLSARKKHIYVIPEASCPTIMPIATSTSAASYTPAASTATVCATCRPSSPGLKQMETSTTRVSKRHQSTLTSRKCPAGHTLKLDYVETGCEVDCNGGREYVLLPGETRWNCEECDFDLCQRCCDPDDENVDVQRKMRLQCECSSNPLTLTQSLVPARPHAEIKNHQCGRTRHCAHGRN